MENHSAHISISSKKKIKAEVYFKIKDTLPLFLSYRILNVDVIVLSWNREYTHEEEVLTLGSLQPEGGRGERRELWRAIEFFSSVSLSPPPPLACAVDQAAGLEWWALPAEDQMKEIT